MDVLYDVLTVLGVIVQPIGLLVFGVMAAWLTLKILDQEKVVWQVQAVAFGIFFAFLAYIGSWLTPGALGALTLGAGAGLVFFGLIQNREKKEK
jgi:hypothetical protein